MFRPSRFRLQPPTLNLIKLLYCQVLLFHVVATQWSDRPKAISHMSLHNKAVGRCENPGGEAEYSNLPNNRVGPFNYVGGRLLRN